MSNQSKKSKEKVKITEKDYFYCVDGKVFKGLTEMIRGVDKMSDETFEHHCNKERNDFKNWVEEVLKRKQLATMLKGHMNREQFKYVLSTYQKNFLKVK